MNDKDQARIDQALKERATRDSMFAEAEAYDMKQRLMASEQFVQGDERLKATGVTYGPISQAIRGAKESAVIKTVADLLDHKIRQAEAEVARLNKIKAETPTVVLGCQLDFINKLKGLI